MPTTAVELDDVDARPRATPSSRELQATFERSEWAGSNAGGRRDRDPPRPRRAGVHLQARRRVPHRRPATRSSTGRPGKAPTRRRRPRAQADPARALPSRLRAVEGHRPVDRSTPCSTSSPTTRSCARAPLRRGRAARALASVSSVRPAAARARLELGVRKRRSSRRGLRPRAVVGCGTRRLGVRSRGSSTARSGPVSGSSLRGERLAGLRQRLPGRLRRGSPNSRARTRTGRSCRCAARHRRRGAARRSGASGRASAPRRRRRAPGPCVGESGFMTSAVHAVDQGVEHRTASSTIASLCVSTPCSSQRASSSSA